MTSENEIAAALGALDPDRTSLMLDFDGTLVDFADRPDAVAVPDDLVRALADLGRLLGGRVAIVTGRPVSDIEGFLPTFDGPIWGAHGAEHRIDGRFTPHPQAGSQRIARLHDRARSFAEARDGVLFEPKLAGLVLHYRLAPGRRGDVERFIDELAGAEDGFEAHPSKAAVELRPDDVGKGQAAAAAMTRPGWDGTLPVFFGDDTTDEPALDWTQAAGGVAVKVGEGETVARLRARHPASVRRLLAQWAGGHR